MQQIIRVSIVIFCALLSMPGIGQATQARKQALARAMQSIQAAYKAEDIGYAERDMDVALSYHAGGFTSIDSQERTLNFDRTHEGLTALFYVLKACQARTTIQHASLRSDGVAVQVIKRISMTPAAHGSHPMLLVQARHDTWERNVLGWRLSHSVIVSEQKTVIAKTAPKPQSTKH